MVPRKNKIISGSLFREGLKLIVQSGERYAQSFCTIV